MALNHNAFIWDCLIIFSFICWHFFHSLKGLDNSGNEESPNKRGASAADSKDVSSPKKKRPKPVD